MLRIYPAESHISQSRKSAPSPALPDPVFLAEQDYKNVLTLCNELRVQTGRNTVDFTLPSGMSLTQALNRGAEVVRRTLGETGVSTERLGRLIFSENPSTSGILKFEAQTDAGERTVSVAVVDPTQRGGKRALAARKADGYKLASELEATTAHVLYRVGTSLEGFRGAVEDARLAERSGLPVEPRYTQDTLFSLGRTSEGLFRYSSMQGVVPGDFGKFDERFRPLASVVLVKITDGDRS